jgi:hypothetical protein
MLQTAIVISDHWVPENLPTLQVIFAIFVHKCGHRKLLLDSHYLIERGNGKLNLIYGLQSLHLV